MSCQDRETVSSFGNDTTSKSYMPDLQEASENLQGRAGLQSALYGIHDFKRMPIQGDAQT